jgi:uncharacterized membrane protein YphA (DoxX/SURF4 family)
MNTRVSPASSRWTLGQAALVAARLFLGAAFLYLGAVKALDPVDFLKQIHAYEILRAPGLVNLTAVTLPWIEMLCGLLLILGVALRGAALVTLLLLLVFTSAVAHRGAALAAAGRVPLCVIKFDCGCGSGEVFVCHKLAENSVLIGLALLPLGWPDQRLRLRRPRRARKGGPASPE